MANTIQPEDIRRVKTLGFLQNKGTTQFNGRIITRNGKITAEQLKCISEAAALYGNGDVEFTTRMTVEVRGIEYDKIAEFRAYVAKAGLETGGTGALVRPVVSCKGTTCQYGLYDTFALSETIHERFYKGYHTVKLPHKFKIACGGCPNNCVKPSLNDLGIVGRMIPGFDAEQCRGCRKCQIEAACPRKAAKVVNGCLQIDETRCNHCGRCVAKCPFHANDNGKLGLQIYIGGRWGKDYAIGRPLNKYFESEDEVLDTIEAAILLFREQGIAGERFSDTIERLGFENVEQELLSRKILERKQEILAKV